MFAVCGTTRDMLAFYQQLAVNEEVLQGHLAATSSLALQLCHVTALQFPWLLRLTTDQYNEHNNETWRAAWRHGSRCPTPGSDLVCATVNQAERTCRRHPRELWTSRNLGRQLQLLIQGAAVCRLIGKIKVILNIT